LSFDLEQNFERICAANDLSLLPNPSQEKILLRLQHFVKQTLHDPVFRRALRYQPAEALAQHGFDASHAPDSLGVKHYTVDVLIHHAQLFGLLAPEPVEEPRFELRLLTYGVKPAALLHGDEQTLTNLLHWCQQHGLTALLSPDEWEPVQDEGKGGYSNLTGARSRACAGSGAERSLVVAQDPDHAMLAWLSLLFGWDTFLGNLLGYPSCCTHAFAERWPLAAQQHQGDPTVLSLNASKGWPFDSRVNIAARYFGFELIQHFPCRFDCEHSRKLASNYFTALQYFEPETALVLEYYLHSAIIYSEYEGISLITDVQCEVEGNTLRVSYDNSRCLHSKADSELARVLSVGSGFDVDRNALTLTINNKRYDKIYFMLFEDSAAVPSKY
jgi:hypothetical protein